MNYDTDNGDNCRNADRRKIKQLPTQCVRIFGMPRIENSRVLLLFDSLIGHRIEIE